LPLVQGVGPDLGRVLLNLLNNAFYAVQKRQLAGEPGYQPTVGVATRRVGNAVEVRVHDNGTSPEVQAKIFQPFFTTKPTGEGTGPGLSLAHEIVTQGHGGTLTVQSQAGQGTGFTLRLPAWRGVASLYSLRKELRQRTSFRACRGISLVAVRASFNDACEIPRQARNDVLWRPLLREE